MKPRQQGQLTYEGKKWEIDSVVLYSFMEQAFVIKKKATTSGVM